MDAVTQGRCLRALRRERLPTRLLEQAARNAGTHESGEVMHHLARLLDRPGMPDLQALLQGPLPHEEPARWRRGRAREERGHRFKT